MSLRAKGIGGDWFGFEVRCDVKACTETCQLHVRPNQGPEVDPLYPRELVGTTFLVAAEPLWWFHEGTHLCPGHNPEGS